MIISQVPPEILAKIFAEVPCLLDLLACGRVCKDFHQVFKDSTRLQYRIELEKSGMVNNSYCTLPTPARVKMLCERERAWGHFNWKFITKDITAPLEASPIYAGASRIMVLGLLDPDMSGGFSTRGFQSIVLPSRDGEDMSAAWETADVGENILNFGIAFEEHDLLAYVAQQVSMPVLPEKKKLMLSPLLQYTEF